MTMITGRENILNFRHRTLLKGLELEANHGLTLSRGQSCYKIIKREFGLKGSKKKVLEQFKQILEESE